MTLGGLALAIGILVDEATVEIENIHTQMGHTPTIAHAVRAGNAQTAIPAVVDALHLGPCFCPRSLWRLRLAGCSCRCRWPSPLR